MLKEMNDAMSYIEKHLAEELNLDERIPQLLDYHCINSKKYFFCYQGCLC
ncbi:hypothetical protein GCM10008931_34110 [Oceanobacillus oncorhynchi subsp. oncorhynchi]